MEGPGCHVAIVKDTANEREGGIAGGEDDFVGELKAEVVRDENEEVGEVAKRGGDLCVVVAWVMRVSTVRSLGHSTHIVVTIQILEKVRYGYATDRVFCLPALLSFLSKPVEHGGFPTEKASCFSGAGVERFPLLIQPLDIPLARCGNLLHPLPGFHRILKQLSPFGVFLLDSLQPGGIFTKAS